VVTGDFVTELESNAEWKRWGKEDPLWGVASWAGKQKDGASPWSEEEFYALGQSDWADFLDHWRQYGINTGNCLEIGCGAGRITKQLAMSFDHGYAVDVSEDMISRAQKAVENANVEFLLIDGLHLPQSDGSVTAVFSAHVLQHLDSEEIGFAYFREFFRVLEAGGTIMVHLPLYQFPEVPGGFGAFMRYQYSLYRSLSNFRAHMKRKLGAKIMRVTPYPIKALSLFLSDLDFKKVEFHTFPLMSNGSHHPFVFAAK
jgi:ubiquinone/menaquinone biosynthesis C-methylase UbiE